MDTKASRKVSCNANRGVLLKSKSVEVEWGGWWFLQTPQGGRARGKWWGVNFRQTLCALFVFLSPPKKQSLSSFRSSNNICKQLQAYKKGEGAQNTMQLTPLPIKTELNKSSSSNHSHMNTCVAVIQPAKDIFAPLVQIPSYITSVCV